MGGNGTDAPHAAPPSGWGVPAAGSPAWTAPPDGKPWDVPGWGRPPLTHDERVVRRRRSGLWLGVASLAVGLGAIFLFVLGLIAIFVGGFLLMIGSVFVALAAVGLAIGSLVSLVRVREVRTSTKLLSAIPACLTLLLFGSIASVVLRPSAPSPLPATRPAPPALSPVLVTDRAVTALTRGDAEAVCAVLDFAARGPYCVSDPALRPARPPFVWKVEPVRESGGRALVSYEAGDPGDRKKHRLRLVVGSDGWRLLDLPGRVDRCVDTARDPFTCPVHRFGARLTSPG